ncbi:MAG TPA: hypothetical protein VG603_04640, partial [Chitinophagales bacterium]|nr:hypothetical protein [Chitinophagales bacterium]
LLKHAGMAAKVYMLLVGLLLCVWLHGQTPAMYPPVNLDSLSPEDKLLLETYKDSFDTELEEFLGAVGDKKFYKFDTTVYNMDHSSHCEVGVGFASRILINGRDVDVKGVGFYPVGEYIHKTGFYVGAGMSFYTDSTLAHAAPVPSAVLTAGYSHLFFKRWLLGASYAHTFINYGSTDSRTLLSNNFTLATAVDMWKRLVLTAAFGVDFSGIKDKSAPGFEKRSYDVALTLRKDFVIYKFIGAKVFTITPAFAAYFATDNMAFIRERSVAEQQLTGLGRFTIAIDHFFGFVNMEPSLTLDWRIRNLDIMVMPALAIPFNTFDYTINQRVHNPKEYRFYVDAGIKYLFCIKKKAKANTKGRK